MAFVVAVFYSLLRVTFNDHGVAIAYPFEVCRGKWCWQDIRSIKRNIQQSGCMRLVRPPSKRLYQSSRLAACLAACLAVWSIIPGLCGAVFIGPYLGALRRGQKLVLILAPGNDNGPVWLLVLYAMRCPLPFTLCGDACGKAASFSSLFGWEVLWLVPEGFLIGSLAESL